MISSLEFKKAVDTVVPTNHVFVADVSGSMYYDLPKIRKHLKDNLASIVKPEDTVSILYFSSRGQYGSVFVGEKVSSIADLSTIHAAIDRYLKPTGCTGFVEPLKHAADVALDLTLENGNLNSLVFMTDGYDNCWRENEILGACQALPSVFSNITFLEYGWYCNRPLLEKMAEATNAFHTFTENFDQYEPAFESAMKSQMGKRIQVEAKGHDHVVYKDTEGRLNVVNVTNDIASIPENAVDAWATSENTDLSDCQDDTAKYVALFYAIHRMNTDLAWTVIASLGDVKIAKMYQNCFTKQDYSNVKDYVASAVNDATLRFVDGINYNVVPDENAPTVLDALEVLIKHNAELDLEKLDYNRTGRKTKQKADTTVSDLASQIGSLDSLDDMQALAQKMVEHDTWTPKFVGTVKTVPLNKLVFNSNRPNLSINTDMKGYVDVPASIQSKHNLPAQLETKIYRNYTVVRDGIINMKSIPVFVDADCREDLEKIGVEFDSYLTACGANRRHIVVHLDSVPLVNRAMVKKLEGKKFCEAHLTLQFLKARQKVFKHYREQLIGKVNALGLAQQFGEEAAKFLSEQGIRDYGFSPKTEREESTDVYMSKELNVKIKGLSSLPSLSAVQKKIDGNKKLNTGDLVMKAAMDMYAEQAERLSEDDLKDWLHTTTQDTIKTVRAIEGCLSRIMYGVVVANRWFNDIDFDSPSMMVNVFGVDADVTLALEEKEIKI